MTAKSKTTTTKSQSVSEFCTRRKLDPKVVRRQLRSLGLKKPKTGWRITSAIAKQLA